MIFKQQLQQRLVTFHALVDFFGMFFKKVEKIYKMQIQMDSGKKIQLKRIRKPQLLLSQDELMENKHHCMLSLHDKSQKRAKKERSQKMYGKS